MHTNNQLTTVDENTFHFESVADALETKHHDTWAHPINKKNDFYLFKFKNTIDT
jgi:hypothetical protein